MKHAWQIVFKCGKKMEWRTDEAFSNFQAKCKASLETNPTSWTKLFAPNLTCFCKIFWILKCQAWSSMSWLFSDPWKQPVITRTLSEIHSKGMDSRATQQCNMSPQFLCNPLASRMASLSIGQKMQLTRTCLMNMHHATCMGA